jgi:hypothetical protein
MRMLRVKVLARLVGVEAGVCHVASEVLVTQ